MSALSLHIESTDSMMLIKPSIMLCFYANYAAILTNYASFLHQKCFSDLPKDLLVHSIRALKRYWNFRH